MSEKIISGTITFPVISLEKTGKNIERLRKERGISVKELQEFFGFEQPQAIYKWQWGDNLPSVDNLYALGKILNVPMEKILVEEGQDLVINRPFLSGVMIHFSRYMCRSCME